jgi:arylformamidase
MTAHAGTHFDAPVHFLEGAPGMEAMPLDAGLGPARVIEIRDPEAVTVDELERHDPRPGERLLFKTENSRRPWWDEMFDEDFIFIAADAAQMLAQRKVRLVGIDALSVGGHWRDMAQTHRALLGAGVWILEGLNLCDIEPGDWDLAAMPLRIPGADGAPARAALRRRA